LAAIRRAVTGCTPGATSIKLRRMERDRNERQRGSAFGVFFFAALAAIILASHATSAAVFWGLAGLASLLGIAAVFCAVRIAVPLFHCHLDLPD
jgi:hypothetical protein